VKGPALPKQGPKSLSGNLCHYGRRAEAVGLKDCAAYHPERLKEKKGKEGEA